MKNKLLLILVAGLGYILMSSYSSGVAVPGVAQNRTGAGGSTADCSGSGCHDPNSSSVNLSIVLVDLSTGDTVTNGKYTPDGVYHIKLFAGPTSRPECGFQFTAARANGLGGGNYIPTSGLQSNVIPPYEIVEQTNPIPASANNTFSVPILWKAPPVGSGSWTLYATMLLSNDDNFAIGDITNNSQRTLNEGPAAIDELGTTADFKLFPKPATTEITLQMTNVKPGELTLLAYTSEGKIVMTKKILPSTSLAQTKVDVSEMAPGNYFLQLIQNGKRRILPFVKL